MNKRIVEISSPARLSVKNSQLVVRKQNGNPDTVPLEDLGVIIFSNPKISHTQALLSSCWKNNIAVVMCDGSYMPGGILLPLEGHSLHSKVLREQCNIKPVLCKQLWQTIVQAKVKAQAELLCNLNRESFPLFSLIKKVRSGDPSNVEAQAARLYWPQLFGGEFRRDPGKGGINSLLNYGYAIIRSALARAVVATGLHPAIGIHHHNQYNSFALVDDLIEPLRPLVDKKVFSLSEEYEDIMLDTYLKNELVKILGSDCYLSGDRYPFFTACQMYLSSFRDIVCQDRRELSIPELFRG